MMIRISRRDFLAAFGLSFFSSSNFSCLASMVDKHVSLFASAYIDDQKRYGIAILDQDGTIVAWYPLPARGHGMAFANTSALLVIFARRPGNFGLAIDVKKRKEPVLFKSPSHTRFYGHGTFSSDEKLLYATENAFESGIGVIGIYDVTNGFARIGEFPSHGIGPHEIILMPDERTLCVANGGILTHPDTGRAKLNLSEMRSSIVFLGSHHGERIAQFYVPKRFQRLSLRHMAVDHRRTVWLGGQYEGSAFDAVPLIATVNDGKGLVFVEVDPVHTHSLAHYIGSVATNMDSHEVAFTSPKGNTVLIIDTAKRVVISQKTRKGACGIASMRESFIVGSMSDGHKINNQVLYLDNHMTGF